MKTDFSWKLQGFELSFSEARFSILEKNSDSAQAQEIQIL